MLPANRGGVGEQRIRDRLAAAAQGLNGPPEIDGVPERDGGGDEGETADAVLLELGAAVAQPAEAVEANGAGERVVDLTLVQLRRRLPAQLRSLQRRSPVTGGSATRSCVGP